MIHDLIIFYFKYSYLCLENPIKDKYGGTFKLASSPPATSEFTLEIYPYKEMYIFILLMK